MANELTRQNDLKLFLGRDQVKAALAKVYPATMTPDRIVTIALLAASRNPRLAECTQPSILKSLMTAGELGLEPSGPLGHGHLVPFKNNKIGAYECTFMPGYRGLIHLAKQTGEVRNVEARVVKEGDVFDVDYGTEPRVVHKPKFNGGDMIAVYAVAFLADGTQTFDVMTRTDVDKIRRRSRAADDGPWVTDYEEMARKTVVKRLAKYLPLRPGDKLVQAIDLDNRIESGEADLTDALTDIPRVREVAEVDINAIHPADEPNRGHGNEGFDATPAEPPPLTDADKAALEAQRQAGTLYPPDDVPQKGGRKGHAL
jgi:recombination protein RecT